MTTLLRAAPPWRRPAAFHLHEVEVRPASNEIVHGDRVTRIKPRLMDLLLRLVAEPGAVVERATLLDQVWSRRMVNDDVLSRAVADLRTALGDDAREARYIETIPKVGYRLIAPIAEIGIATSEPPLAATPVASVPTATLPGVAGRNRRWQWWALAGAAATVLGIGWFWSSSPPLPQPTDRAALERQLAQSEPFSSDVKLEISPRFSHDGRTIAFAAVDGAQAQIVLRDVATGRERRLGDATEINLAPVFFPDGERIAWYRRRSVDDCAIISVDLTSGETQTLVDCSRRPQARFDLSSDGRSLVYVGNLRPQFPQGLLLRDLATGTERTLTAPEPGVDDDSLPRFSPDGTRVAFFRGSQSHRELWLVTVANPAGARAVGAPQGLSYGAAWLGPQGPLLVAADWFGQRALNIVEADGSRAAVLGARGARFPDVDRDGNIIYEHAVYSANLWLVDPANAGAAPRELWPSTRYTNQQEYSPDGRRVVFVSNRDGVSGLYVATEDGPATRLPLSDNYLYMRPHWTHDGRAIYAIRVDRREDAKSGQQALRIPLDGGEPEVLTALGDAVFDVRDASGGASVIVGESSSNAVRLLRTPSVHTAPTERLPFPLSSSYQVAGNQLAMTQPQLSGITLCDLVTRKCDALDLPIDDDNRFDWLLTHEAIWYRSNAAPQELVRYDLARRAITWRSAFGPTAFGLALAVRPDGRALLVARESGPLIDLMLARRLR